MPSISVTPDSAERERSRLEAECKEREKEIATQWGQVAKTVVQNATDHMQEHIHHVKRDLTVHVEECLEYRAAEISQQIALEAGADASAMRVEMIHHIRQNK